MNAMHRTRAGRIVSVVVLFVMLGTTLASGADASRIANTNHASIGDRVRQQGELCDAGGGKMTTLNYSDGNVGTTCNGGKLDGSHCYNSAMSTKCAAREPLPNEDVNSGVANASVGVAEPSQPKASAPHPHKGKHRR
jgi:hypothetical protein